MNRAVLVAIITMAIIGPVFGQNKLEVQYVTSSVSFEQMAPIAGGLTTLFVRGLKVHGSVVKPASYPAPAELGGVRVNIYGRPAPILSSTYSLSAQFSASHASAHSPARMFFDLPVLRMKSRTKQRHPKWNFGAPRREPDGRP